MYAECIIINFKEGAMKQYIMLHQKSTNTEIFIICSSISSILNDKNTGTAIFFINGTSTVVKESFAKVIAIILESNTKQ